MLSKVSGSSQPLFFKHFASVIRRHALCRCIPTCNLHVELQSYSKIDCSLHGRMLNRIRLITLFQYGLLEKTLSVIHKRGNGSRNTRITLSVIMHYHYSDIYWYHKFASNTSLNSWTKQYERIRRKEEVVFSESKRGKSWKSYTHMITPLAILL